MTNHGWSAPAPCVHEGQSINLTPTDAVADVAELFAVSHDSEAAQQLWQFMPCGPFQDAAAMCDWTIDWQSKPDVIAYTVSRRDDGQRVGMISIMRITPAHGVAELGFIWYAPSMQRTKANTESVYLLLRHLFDDLGYRRVEWKCDDQNQRSKAAAQRLGFQFEGLFKQHMAIKGRNRDTAWFAMLDTDWPQRKVNFERWLYGDGSVSLSRMNAADQAPGCAE